MAAIAGNAALGRMLGLIAGVLAYASFRLWLGTRHYPYLAVICALLFVVHTAWMVSVARGDCGYGMVDGAIFHNFVAAGLVIYQVKDFFKTKSCSKKQARAALD